MVEARFGYVRPLGYVQAIPQFHRSRTYYISLLCSQSEVPRNSAMSGDEDDDDGVIAPSLTCDVAKFDEH